MGNTGLQGWKWLIQIDSNGNPTGVRKYNDPLDPDYVPPVINYTACPIPTTTTTSTSTTTTTSTSSTSTTTTTISPSTQPLTIDLINNKSVAIYGQLGAVSDPLATTTYFSNTIFDLAAGISHEFYSGTLSENATKIYIENDSGASFTVGVYYSQNNGTSYSLLRSFTLANGTFDDTSYSTPANLTGLTNKIEVRIS